MRPQGCSYKATKKNDADEGAGVEKLETRLVAKARVRGNEAEQNMVEWQLRMLLLRQSQVHSRAQSHHSLQHPVHAQCKRL
jgi:hypothetical protein